MLDRILSMDETIKAYWESKVKLDAAGLWAPPDSGDWPPGEWLRRRLLDFTSQTDLARRCGVRQPEISRIEGGRDAKFSTLERIAAGLGCELVVRLRPKAPPTGR